MGIDEEVSEKANAARNGGHEERVTPFTVINKVLEADRTKLPEYTPIPQNMQRTITLIRLHVDDILSMCKDIITAQGIWYRNWKYWNTPVRKVELEKTAAELAPPPQIKGGWLWSKPKIITPFIQEGEAETEEEYETRKAIFEKECSDIESAVTEWGKYVDKLSEFKERLQSDNFAYYCLQSWRNSDGNFIRDLMIVAKEQIVSDGGMGGDKDMLGRLIGDTDVG